MDNRLQHLVEYQRGAVNGARDKKVARDIDDTIRHDGGDIVNDNCESAIGSYGNDAIGVECDAVKLASSAIHRDGDNFCGDDGGNAVGLCYGNAFCCCDDDASNVGRNAIGGDNGGVLDCNGCGLSGCNGHNGMREGRHCVGLLERAQLFKKKFLQSARVRYS